MFVSIFNFVFVEWYSAMPDLDSILGNGANVYYSMCDLKSFYTNVTVGYLKIDAGHKKPMTVLKDYILVITCFVIYLLYYFFLQLYFVERGNGIFQVSGRKIAGQIGSTVFIPLGNQCYFLACFFMIVVFYFVFVRRRICHHEFQYRRRPDTKICYNFSNNLNARKVILRALVGTWMDVLQLEFLIFLLVLIFTFCWGVEAEHVFLQVVFYIVLQNVS